MYTCVVMITEIVIVYTDDNPPVSYICYIACDV